MGELIDARGVEIAPGDTAIYGFGVGRSVAMAEAVVLGEHTRKPEAEWSDFLCSHAYFCTCGEEWPCDKTPSVSLTPSGRVRLRVVRRSYSSGTKPVVDVAPDRLVVLKQNPLTPYPSMTLPPSPLPTQDEEYRQRIENLIELYTADLRAEMVPDRHYYEGWDLARFHSYAAQQLAKLRKELMALDE